jgi:ribose transport system substrate-binding protein
LTVKRFLNTQVAACSIVALAFVFGVAVASGATAKANAKAQPYRIAYFSTKSNLFLAAEYAETQKQAKKANVQLTLYDSDLNSTTQYSQIQNAITLGKYNGFMIDPVNGPTLVPLVQQALKAHIKVVAFNSPLGPDPNAVGVQIPGVSAQVWTPTTHRGVWMADQMVRACKGIDPCKVAYLAGIAAIPLEQTIKTIFEAAIAKHSNIQLVAYLDGTDFSRQGGQTVGQNLISAHPDVNVIASGDEALLGVETALQAAGKSYGDAPNQIRLVGIGSGIPVLNEIAAGHVYSTQPDAPDEEGDVAFSAMLQALEGKLKTPLVADPITAMHVPAIITEANVSKIKREHN